MSGAIAALITGFLLNLITALPARYTSWPINICHRASRSNLLSSGFRRQLDHPFGEFTCVSRRQYLITGQLILPTGICPFHLRHSFSVLHCIATVKGLLHLRGHDSQLFHLT